MLKSFLTEGCKAGYESYKAAREPGAVLKTSKEKLLEPEDSKLGIKGRLLRNELEEMLANMPDQVIKEVVRKIGDDQLTSLALAVKGLSKAGRERLLSCMPEIREDDICDYMEYKEYIRIREVDIENAFVRLIDSMEAISGKK